MQPRLRTSNDTNHHTVGKLQPADGRKHRTAENASFPNPGVAGNRCGHCRETHILVETVVETVVKPMTFVETVQSN